MKRAGAFFLLLGFVVGCGSKETPKLDTADTRTKPTTDEARLCISEYMHGFGWQNVDFANFHEETEVPSHAKSIENGHAYQFSATYQNLFGEKQQTKNWVAVLTRQDGKVKLVNCYDEARHLVAGNHGHEEAEKATLTPAGMAPTAPAEVLLPPIVAPK